MIKPISEIVDSMSGGEAVDFLIDNIDGYIVSKTHLDKIKAEWGFLKSDYITHHRDFRNACVMAKNNAENEDDATYWDKQIRTLDRLSEEYTEKLKDIVGESR